MGRLSAVTTIYDSDQPTQKTRIETGRLGLYNLLLCDSLESMNYSTRTILGMGRRIFATYSPPHPFGADYSDWEHTITAAQIQLELCLLT